MNKAKRSKEVDKQSSPKYESSVEIGIRGYSVTMSGRYSGRDRTSKSPEDCKSYCIPSCKTPPNNREEVSMVQKVLEKSANEDPSTAITSSSRQHLSRSILEVCGDGEDNRKPANNLHNQRSSTRSFSSLARPLTLSLTHCRPKHVTFYSYEAHLQPNANMSMAEIPPRDIGSRSTETNIVTDNFDTSLIEELLMRRMLIGEDQSTSGRCKFPDGYGAYTKDLIECLRSNISFDVVTWKLANSIGASLTADQLRVFVVQVQPEELVFTLIESQEEFVQRVPVEKNSEPIIWEAAISLRARCSTSENGSEVFCFPYISTVTKYRIVLEMTRRNRTFILADERVASNMVIWGEASLSFMLSYEEQLKKQYLNQFILNVVEEIFQDVGAIETIVRKIMHFAQKLVSADRSSLFLVDSNKRELYATVFDVRVDELDAASGKSDTQQIRFPIGTGIAGHVALTGNTLNIVDAYKDNRFNKDIDIRTGYRTRTILCMPVFNKDTVIGVIQMVNKRNGELFTEADKDSFKMMAVYCGLALHNAKLYNHIERSEKKYKVALEVLSYHNSCSEIEVTKALKEMSVFEATLVGFSINPFHFDDYTKVLCAVKMFTELFDMNEFEYNTLVRFTFTVKKNYRKLPYHNWTHGFAVANSVYNIILNDSGILTKLEKLALYIGCLCHDLDHRGKSNKFMKETKSPLASIYSTSTMEHHHFNQAVIILQQEGHNIFENLSKSDYKELLGLLRSCILATDIEQFFKNKSAIQDVMDRNEFNFNDESHRHLSLSIVMTGADLSACTKPWHIQAETVCGVNEEFYLQGDVEKAAGRAPIPMMDRTRPDELPSGQVQFMSNICLPCYKILSQLFPDAKELYSGCQQNLDQWMRIKRDIREVNENANSLMVADVANALANMIFGPRGRKKKKKLLRCFTTNASKTEE